MQGMQHPEIMPNFSRVHRALVQLGVDTDAIYRQADIQKQDLDKDRVRVVAYLQVLELASQQIRSPHIGVEIARKRSVADLGLYGYMIRNSSNLRAMLELANQYMDYITPLAVGDIKEQGATALWTYHFPDLPAELCRHDVELSVMEFITMVRETFHDPDWRASAVYFQHGAPGNDSLLTDVMADTVIYDQRFSGAAFPSHMLGVPFNDADLGLLELLRKEVAQAMARYRSDTNIATDVGLAISSGIGVRDISVDRLAADLHMSRRTLHRRLADLGTSVRELRDATVKRLASELLASTDISIADIGSRLGYSDTSSFIRNFKRLTGQSPSRFRRQRRD